MTAWDKQSDGSVLGVATDKALVWAMNGEFISRRLAYIGFVAFCRDAGLDPFWMADDPDHVALTGCNESTVVQIHHDQSELHDKFKVEKVPEGDRWDAVVRIMAGKSYTIHILGLTATLAQRQRDEDYIDRSQLLKVSEWLSQWPQYQTPWAGYQIELDKEARLTK